jgi:hypothetical protein
MIMERGVERKRERETHFHRTRIPIRPLPVRDGCPVRQIRSAAHGERVWVIKRVDGGEVVLRAGSISE